MNNKQYPNFTELVSSKYFTKDPIVLEDYYYTITKLTLEIKLPNTTIILPDITTISVDDFNEEVPWDPQFTPRDEIRYYLRSEVQSTDHETEIHEYETEIHTNSQEEIRWTIIDVPPTTLKDSIEHQLYVELSNDLFTASSLESYREAIHKFQNNLKKGEIRIGH